jgi:hypothetical protein
VATGPARVLVRHDRSPVPSYRVFNCAARALLSTVEDGILAKSSVLKVPPNMRADHETSQKFGLVENPARMILVLVS